MKAIILAAGYATRLYPLTKKRPKPLLPIGSKLMIDYVVENLKKIQRLKTIFVVSNHVFFDQFKRWKQSHSCYRSIQLVDDGTQTAQDRLGAIRDIAFVIQRKKIREDLLVAGGDNLFEYDLTYFVRQGNQYKPYPTVGVYDLGSRRLAELFGVVELNAQNQISQFMEKPSRPRSTLVAMCLYYFPRESLSWIQRYLASGENADAPGHYLSWLVRKKAVYGYLFEKGEWLDIGSLKAYQQAQKHYRMN